MRSPRDDEDGYTLVELTVVMALFGILAVTMATTLTQGLTLFRKNFDRTTATGQATLVMERVSKDVRAAVPNGPAGSQLAFTAATGGSVTFTSSLADVPVLERVYTVPTANPALWDLMLERTLADTGSVAPNYTYATARGRTQTRLAFGTLTSATLFSYLLNDGTTIATVPVASLNKIVGVRVLLSIRVGPAANTRAIVLDSTVRPFNL